MFPRSFVRLAAIAAVFAFATTTLQARYPGNGSLRQGDRATGGQSGIWIPVEFEGERPH